MKLLFALLLVFLLNSLLLSCASTDGKRFVDSSQDIHSPVKYAVWRTDAAAGLDAISGLLAQADALIDTNAYEAATDKLERVLRVNPEYAPAWSRLSWLALQTGSARRSVQMAKRSNSFAYSNTELQSLNWSFILEASIALDDEQAILRARQKLQSLTAL